MQRPIFYSFNYFNIKFLNFLTWSALILAIFWLFSKFRHSAIYCRRLIIGQWAQCVCFFQSCLKWQWILNADTALQNKKNLFVIRNSKKSLEHMHTCKLVSIAVQLVLPMVTVLSQFEWTRNISFRVLSQNPFLAWIVICTKIIEPLNITKALKSFEKPCLIVRIWKKIIFENISVKILFDMNTTNFMSIALPPYLR